MKRVRLLTLVLAAGLSPVLSGCWGGSQYGSQASGTGYPGPADTISARDAGGTPPASGRAPLGQRPTAEPRSVYDRVSDTFQQVSTQIGDALNPEPRTQRAYDPLRLSDNPGEIKPDIFILQGQMLERRGETDRAIAQYRKALERAPKDRRALIALARLYDRNGDFARAVPLYQQAIEHHPRFAAAYNSLGLCYARSGNLRQAAEQLVVATRLEPTKPIHRNNLSTVLVELGHTDDALKQLSAVHRPEIAHYNVAFLLSEKGKHDEARRHLSEALRINPKLAQARHLMARLNSGNPHEPNRGRPAADNSRNVHIETEATQVETPPVPSGGTFPLMRLPTTGSNGAIDAVDDVGDEAKTSPLSDGKQDFDYFAPEPDGR